MSDWLLTEAVAAYLIFEVEPEDLKGNEMDIAYSLIGEYLSYGTINGEK